MIDYGVTEPITIRDLKVGQTMYVDADQGVRKGVLKKIGRTRATIEHPRNQAGTLAQRAYPIERIVMGRGYSAEGELLLCYGDGSIWPPTHPIHLLDPDMPVLFDERTDR